MKALRSSIVWAAALVFAASATAARADDFYRDKTLTMIVGFAPGGGVDTTARVVARHLQRFIPGAQSIVVQNMEGAAGLVATPIPATNAPYLKSARAPRVTVTDATR